MKKEICVIVQKQKERRYFCKIRESKREFSGITYTELAVFGRPKRKKLTRYWQKNCNKFKTVILPPNSRPGRYYLNGADVFSQTNALSRLTVCIAAEILHQNRTALLDKSVCLADKSGCFAKTSCDMIADCGVLKIVTDNPAIYHKYSDRILYEHGTEPVITKTPDKCDVVILPFAHFIYIGSERFELNLNGIRTLDDNGCYSENQLSLLLASFLSQGFSALKNCVITLKSSGGDVDYRKIVL